MKVLERVTENFYVDIIRVTIHLEILYVDTRTRHIKSVKFETNLYLRN